MEVLVMGYRRFAFVSTLIIFGFLAAIAALAQDDIEVTVSATAASAPVLDLSKANFSLQDSGKPQGITTFSGPATVSAPAKLAPNEFSSIPDFRESSGAVFVVFDTIHTRYIDERDERGVVLKFLAKAAQAKHAVTLAVLSDKGLIVYHDYHSGSDLLLAALAKAGLGGMKGVAVPSGLNDAQVNAEAARLAAFSKGDQSNPTADNQLLRSNIGMVLTMFQDVGYSAEGLPGRKELVWVTNAVPFDIDPKTMLFKSPQESSHGVAVDGVAVGGTKDQLNTGEVKRLTGVWRHSIRALFDGGVAVYPVEVRGSASAATNTFTQIAMKTLADLTGGKAFFGVNDPFPELLAISNGNTAGYELGFTPASAPNSDFRRLDVMVARSGVDVGHPAGYFTYEGTSKARAGTDIGVAIGSPLAYSGVRFRVAVGSIEDGTAGKKKVNLVITLPGDSGVLNPSTGTVDVGFVAQAVNPSGQVVGKMNEGAGNKFPPDAVAQIKESGFQLKRSFEVSPGECTVHFLVRDNQTGRMGDVIFPLSVK
jgi:VWFA-related protein